LVAATGLSTKPPNHTARAVWLPCHVHIQMFVYSKKLSQNPEKNHKCTHLHLKNLKINGAAEKKLNSYKL
jgi:hypothetical protein